MKTLLSTIALTATRRPGPDVTISLLSARAVTPEPRWPDPDDWLFSFDAGLGPATRFVAARELEPGQPLPQDDLFIGLMDPLPCPPEAMQAAARKR